MTNLYAEWKKLQNNAERTSARLYYTKNENTEREFDEAVEVLVNFEKDNGIPPMANEAKVKEMFCPQTNEEWFDSLSTEEKAKVLACEFTVACDDYAYSNNKETWNERYWGKWLKQLHTPKE